MNLNNIHKVYFIGIGGIGMSALARYFKSMGKNVAGYDLTGTDLTNELIAEGIDVHFKDDIKKIAPEFRQNENTLIVYTPAVPSGHSELNYFRSHKFQMMKRSEVLGMLTIDKKTIAVAGTHGKTTISTMISCIMAGHSLGCTAFLGGISNNFASNLYIDTESEFIVTEADEFDRSFLRIYPDICIVSAIDADHLDIYKNKRELEKAFAVFVNQTKQKGKIIYRYGLDIEIEDKDYRISTYSLNSKEADFYAENIQLVKGKYQFDLVTPEKRYQHFSLSHPGIINVENAVAAIAATYLAGVDINAIRENLIPFSGIKRRFDIQIKTDDLIYMDDYAHHPKEIDALIGSMRNLYPDKKITGIFQPHLYTRTRDFAGEFARSLAKLDDLILLDIYPARERPIKGVSAKMIFEKCQMNNKQLCKKENVISHLKERPLEIILTIGAGDIAELVKPIKDFLINEKVKKYN